VSSPPDESESGTGGSGSYADRLAAAKLDPDRADFRTLRREKTPKAVPKGIQPRITRRARIGEEGIPGFETQELSDPCPPCDPWLKLFSCPFSRPFACFAVSLPPLRSIFESGDGRGFDTAFVVIDTREEYAVVEALGLRPTQQALMEGRGSKFDVLTVSHPETGQTAQMFFNIDLVFGRGIGSELGGPPPKKPRRWWQFWK
jgi:hypothetical protein